MKERPILFNTDMVRAILAGKKTQTRRIIKRTPSNDEPCGYGFWKEFNERDNTWYVKDYTHSCTWWPLKEYIERFSRYHVGDVLYVRETWANTWTPNGLEGFVYKADGKPPIFPYWGNARQCKDEVWIPSIHMPKEAARIFLKVLDVRVERLQDITIEEIQKEGIKLPITQLEFMNLWNSTIKKSNICNYGWDANPWIWVIEFERIEHHKNCV